MKKECAHIILSVGVLLACCVRSLALDHLLEVIQNAHTAWTARNGISVGSHVLVKHLKFSHLTTSDGLSQGYVTAILQDRHGFMWFATRDGLNRYDGNAFVVYKNIPNDPTSLSSNFLQDLIEDENGYLWISTNTGVNRFNPTTERCTRYLHDVNDPDGIGSAYVTSIARDSAGYLWFGTVDSGIDR